MTSVACRRSGFVGSARAGNLAKLRKHGVEAAHTERSTDALVLACRADGARLATVQTTSHPITGAGELCVATGAAGGFVHGRIPSRNVRSSLLCPGMSLDGTVWQREAAWGTLVPVVRIDRVYTRTGDDGSTALGGGQRVPKDSFRIEAYGTVDELNSVIGVAVAMGVAEPLREPLFVVQQVLFNLGADLCILESDKERLQAPRIEARHVEQLERWMDAWNAELELLRSFVLPGGDAAAAQLHVARTVCRRAERRVIALAREEPVGKHVVPYLNRLGDFLFVAARYQAKLSGKGDVLWDSRAF